MYRLVIFVACFHCSVLSLSAGERAIFGKRITPQPFEKTPFQQVEIPEWLESTIGCGYTLSVMDKKAREEAVRHGVTISEMGFVDPYYAYYDSKLLKRRNPGVPVERIRQEIEEYNALGLKILGVYPPTLQGEVYELHPDWRRIATNTNEVPQVDLKIHPYGGMLCLLGPYGDFFIEVLAEIATTFPEVDAFSFDGLHYGGVCYCQHCRDNYHQESREEIPNPDLNDPKFRKYQHWADRRMENLIQRMQTRLKGINPDLALVTWTTNAGRWGHFLSIPRNMPARMNLLLDAPDQEFWLDETNRGTTVVPAFANAYMWALTNHRVAFSEPYLMSHGNPYGKDSFPSHEIERRMMLSLSYGVAPSIAVIQPPRLQRELYQIMDLVQERKPWLTHKKPEKWAALLMSDNTRNFYGRSPGQVEERYMANVLGAFRVCIEEHLPVAIINDWNLNLEDLKEYQVLILPNAACLDDLQVRAIEEFVAQGGGVVASHDTSLFDEFGSPRESMALGNLFGIVHQGVLDSGASEGKIDENFARSIGPDYWSKQKNVFDLKISADWLKRAPEIGRLLDQEPVTFKGPGMRIRVREENGVQILGTMQPKYPPPGTTAPGPDAPAIVARDLPGDQGRGVYFAAALDSAYYLYSYPYQRELLAESIRWAARKGPPIEVKAPMCLHANLFRQTKEGERLVLHLYNDLNTTAHHAFPADDVPLREEVVPIHEIAVSLSPHYSISRIHEEPSGLDSLYRSTKTGHHFTVSKLDVHKMIVIELNPNNENPPR